MVLNPGLGPVDSNCRTNRMFVFPWTVQSKENYAIILAERLIHSGDCRSKGRSLEEGPGFELYTD